jgi:regulator of PEP synthase PpsR (kinase-PPPase family)
MPSPQATVYFHLHLVSDATGETLNAVAKAACAQFDAARPIEHFYALVRSRKHLDQVLQGIEDAPGVVFFTMVNDELRAVLEARCRELNMPVIAVLDPVVDLLGSYLGAPVSHKPGRQHVMNAEYFSRIEALNFTMTHDDGQGVEGLPSADVVLIGVSRTSKTPTCIYLANRGVKAANVPLVPNRPLPPEVETLRGPLMVGLTASPDRLMHIRRNRLRFLHESIDTDYADYEAILREIAASRRLFVQHGWPVIDVSRRSIEETAASILSLLSTKRDVAAATVAPSATADLR